MELESNMMGASCTSLKELYYHIKISFIFFFLLAMNYPKKESNPYCNPNSNLGFFFWDQKKCHVLQTISHSYENQPYCYKFFNSPPLDS
jgi:hypothetical protein